MEFECNFDENALGDDYELVGRGGGHLAPCVDPWRRAISTPPGLLEITEEDDGRVLECMVYQSDDSRDIIAIEFVFINLYIVHEHTTVNVMKSYTPATMRTVTTYIKKR